MKIAIITDVLGEENNGTTITTKRLIENMQQRGHEVLVISPSKLKETWHYSLPRRNFYIFNKYIEKNGVVLALPDKDLLKEIISKVDIVHILLPFKTGQCAIKIANELNKPVTTGFHSPAEAFTVHIGLNNLKILNNYIYKRFLKKFYQFSHFIHCPSPLIANTIQKHGYNMNLKIISNGVTPIFKKIQIEKPEHLKNKFVILYVGRLSREKRHDVLIDAVLNSKYQDKIQLIFAGHGPLKKKIEKHSEKLINKPIIEFYTKEKLVEVINYSDLYTHPSDIEVEAIACLEAISCGKVPVISDSKKSATKLFALSEENLFKAGNSASLTERLNFFIENPNKIKELEEKYENYAKEFEIENCMNQMEEMFIEAINYTKHKTACN